jgi:hypothetical protein
MLRRSTYYTGSTMLLLALTGCASLNSRAAGASRVPFASMAEDKNQAMKLQTLPVVLVFEKGDHVPVRFDVDSALFELAPRPLNFELIASQRFYLLLLPDGPPRVSLDGVDFEKVHKNAFRFGFYADKDRGAGTDVAIGIWREAPPPSP